MSKGSPVERYHAISPSVSGAKVTPVHTWKHCLPPAGRAARPPCRPRAPAPEQPAGASPRGLRRDHRGLPGSARRSPPPCPRRSPARPGSLRRHRPRLAQRERFGPPRRARVALRQRSRPPPTPAPSKSREQEPQQLLTPRREAGRSAPGFSGKPFTRRVLHADRVFAVRHQDASPFTVYL